MQKAQASLEYFIIFAVIAGLTLLSVSAFLTKTRQSGQALFNTAAARIVGNTPTEPTPHSASSCNPNAPLGSTINPIPLNQDSGWGSIYYPTGGREPAGSTIHVSSKVCFSVDSSAIGQAIGYFGIVIKGYSNFNYSDVVYSRIVQDKATCSELEPETNIGNNQGDMWDEVHNNKPFNFDNTRFVYCIDPGAHSSDIDIWVQFMPQQ